MKKQILTVIVMGALAPVGVLAQQSVSTSSTATTTASDPVTGQAQTVTRQNANSQSTDGMGDTHTRSEHAASATTVNPDGTVVHRRHRRTKATSTQATPDGVQQRTVTTEENHSSVSPQ